MKCISLYQPYASAIPAGLKKIETRSWATTYRGLILIHAARKFPKECRRLARLERWVGRCPWALPYGMIVGEAQLVDVKPVEEVKPHLSALELLYGNYSAGRFAWILEDTKAFAEPIPYGGAQRIFNVPDEIYRRLK
jgi:activating signal cointegrator 1